jgi:hypothetical protein
MAKAKRSVASLKKEVASLRKQVSEMRATVPERPEDTQARLAMRGRDDRLGSVLDDIARLQGRTNLEPGRRRR